jgi:hypothetical protein
VVFQTDRATRPISLRSVPFDVKGVSDEPAGGIDLVSAPMPGKLDLRDPHIGIYPLPCSTPAFGGAELNLAGQRLP